MATQIFQDHSISGKETLGVIKESEGGSKESGYISDDGVDDRHSTSGKTQVSPFCTIVLFIYAFYIFFLAAFIVVSTIFIKTEDARPGPKPTNNTNT